MENVVFPRINSQTRKKGGYARQRVQQLCTKLIHLVDKLLIASFFGEKVFENSMQVFLWITVMHNQVLFIPRFCG
ncbi:hypothetical protein CF160_09855 [Enterococcus pseudoavium]|nr:hypothetical protein CF160_09855 [Enterococcus pseudoavium]